MKNIFLIAFALLVPSIALAEDQSPQEIIASCNMQTGQAILTLGQSQQQVINLQKQVADLEKQVADLKASADAKKGKGQPH